MSEERIDHALRLLRRVGVVVGVLFGLAVIAAVMADKAAADERDSTSESSGMGWLTESVTAPLTAPVADAVQPVSDGVVEPLAPVVRAVVEPVAPVIRLVTEAVAPVTEPVLRSVVAAARPVLDPVLVSVAPVTEPLLSPVLDAAEPVADPVAEATGLDEVTDAVAGDVRRQDGVAPVDWAPPRPVAPVGEPVPSRSSGGVGSANAEEIVHSGPAVQRAPSAPEPGAPGTPFQFAVTGGGSAGGSGGAHSAHALVSGSDTVRARRDISVRGPPGTITGVAWFAYDDRDHPS